MDTILTLDFGTMEASVPDELYLNLQQHRYNGNIIMKWYENTLNITVLTLVGRYRGYMCGYKF